MKTQGGVNVLYNNLVFGSNSKSKNEKNNIFYEFNLLDLWIKLTMFFLNSFLYF